MRLNSIVVPGPFKRFGSLSIAEVPSQAQLVLLVGPNGSGKSSVFEAMLFWSTQNGKSVHRGGQTAEYYSSHGSPGIPDLRFHEDGAVGTKIHLRTAHRNTPTVLVDQIRKATPVDRRVVTDRMIETDLSLADHYQRVVGLLMPILSDLQGADAAAAVETARGVMEPVAAAVQRLFPSLAYSGVGDPTDSGSFHFVRDGERAFRFENLSGGEKAVFDLLLDVHLAQLAIDGPIIGIDEPELHIGPPVHARLLDELLGLAGGSSQLWLATHSVGMIRRAFELARATPGRVAFLDFTDVEGAEPIVDLTPVEPSRQFLRRALTVAMDTLVDLQVPERLYVCEGDPDAVRAPEWDARVYRAIFGEAFLSVDFLSGGGKAQLASVARLAGAIAPGSQIFSVRDRDQLPDADRQRLLDDDGSLRILRRVSLESYLVADAVVDALVAARGCSDAAALRAARDAAMSNDGSAKRALGALFEASRAMLTDVTALGENKWQFGAGVLAPLVVAGMDVYDELVADLKL